MTGDVIRDYVDFLTKENSGPNKNRTVFFVFVAVVTYFGLLGIAIIVYDLVMGSPIRPLSTGLPLLLAIAINEHHTRRKRFKKQLALAEQGVLVWARLVQANKRLFQAGSRNEVLPCLVLFSFDVDGTSRRMEELALKIYALKDQVPTDPELKYVRSLVANERAVFHRCRQLPASFVGDSTPIYVADLYILRRYLKNSRLVEPYLLCLAGTTDAGVDLVPWQVQEGQVPG